LSLTGIGFGPQLVGTASATQSLTVTNTGDFSTNVSATLSDASQFQTTTNNCLSIALAPAATCDVQFVFNPTSPGDKVARFNVSTPNYGPLPVVLSGTALDPTCSSTTLGTDVSAPKFIGATVTLIASSAGCTNASPLYQFRLRTSAGVWSTLQDFSPSASAPWNTTGYAPGTYLIAVYVKDAASTKAYDTYAFNTFTLQFPNCTWTNVDAGSPSSPQVSGTTVNFTASVSPVCPNPLFQWWVRNAAGVWSIVPGHDFAHSVNTFSWNTTGLPSGTYQVGVWAKQTGSTKSYDAYSFITYTLAPPIAGITRCKAVNVIPDLTSPQAVGTTVTFTANPVLGCIAPQFKWWVRNAAGVWAVVKDYPLGTNTYAWTTGSLPAGSYQVGVWVRQTGSSASYEAYSFVTYTLTLAPAAQPCTAAALSPSVPSPQTPGTTVTFTASSTGCAATSYKWLVAAPGGAFVQAQPYGAPATFIWNTTGLAPGIYQVAVYARHTGAVASYEAWSEVSFEVRKDNVPCTSVTLATAPPGQIASGAIGFTPTAAGCSPSTYRYYVRHGNTGSFVQAGSQLAPFTLSLNGYLGGWWTVKVLAEDPTWPGVFDGTVYTDFLVN
jgi:hypothetical protein